MTKNVSNSDGILNNSAITIDSEKIAKAHKLAVANKGKINKSSSSSSLANLVEESSTIAAPSASEPATTATTTSTTTKSKTKQGDLMKTSILAYSRRIHRNGYSHPHPLLH